MATKSRGVNAAHTAGIFADMSLDGPEIGTLVAVVDRAKNLPNRKTMGKQDPYCAMRLGKEAKKTDTDRRGGQTPRWDQELRFNVHECPDYYKLKCSVFNDDKKTDLIGEAWIDLREVILPGGGKNDLWHQLNFKGKYAGEIRIELTYYDSRPKPEVSSERRKQREKSQSIVSDVQNSSSGSRQLGPREIKRRPLPPGPGGYSSPVSISHTPEYAPSEEATNAWTAQDHGQSHAPPRPPKQLMFETPDDVGFGLQSQYPLESYGPPGTEPYDLSPPPLRPPKEQQRPSNDYYNQPQRHSSPHDTSDYYTTDGYRERPLPPTQPTHPYVTGESPRPEPDRLPSPHSPLNNAPDHTPYHSSPPNRTTPQATPPRPGQGQTRQGRGSTSPTKHAVYRDSPLRHSISQHEMPHPEYSYPDPRFDEEDAPPPPPPAHRGPVSRMPMPATSSSFPGTSSQPSPRTPVKYDSVEERSPLQRLEQYDPYSSPYSRELPNQSALPHPSQRSPRDTYMHPQPSPPHSALDERYEAYALPSNERAHSFNDNMAWRRPTSSGNNLPPFNDSPGRSPGDQRYGELPQDDLRRSIGYGSPRRAQTFDDYGHHDERQHRRSEPVIVRPRAISPNPARNIPRKSVTPTPTTPEDQRQISGMPFGPDAYDVLNPGTSPTVEDGLYRTSHAAREASRQIEVDRMRDQGPIIGNDGRVIDPSDHLPAETWAPEPERKNRQPEHVIRIRTREEARIQHAAGSSPISVRPHSVATSPYQASPSAGASSPFHGSPIAAGGEPSPRGDAGGGRNRLKKPMPARPLPVQPYPHAQTSPAVMTTSTNDARPSPSNQRYTIHASPTGATQRPPLSEYQAPAMNEYSPRGAPEPQVYPPIPTKVPHHGLSNSMDYGGYGRDNSLALELSTIDIGPSRKTALRSSRGYGAY
ncbi:hypothetical protein LTR06_004640 [Exophiala xenobiotica]|nr:hypothetical protein LTR06_004640 [Exophiala xenobiotica]KAK5445631.1 hypothetical protein LTR18_003550 [Exophiala xenobiotica]